MKQGQGAELLRKINSHEAVAGVIGLGYVGLPLAIAAARAGFNVIGFDTDVKKIEMLNSGKSYIDAVKSRDLKSMVEEKKFRAEGEFIHFAECDIVIICVPTPLSKQREPDLSYVKDTAENISRYLHIGQLVVLESTTYPDTTLGIVKPILERSGLRAGIDFWIGFSPEREDPGSKKYSTVNIPKIVGGDGGEASELMAAFYGNVVEKVVVVSNPSVAEAVKITENIFRAVNIALVNELKVIYDAMGIDIWEVIDAASTKPFGYMPFYPGPGLGGHCIPVDPFYLTWKAREYGLSTRFIELSGEINVSMPRYVIARLEQSLDTRQKISLSSASILIVGLAYKPNVSDIRESPTLVMLETLVKRGASVDYYDPHVQEIPKTREHPDLSGWKSVELTTDTLSDYDAVLIATDHDEIDYRLLAEHAKLIVDTRNCFARRNIVCRNLVKA
ncbi:MAG: nucleotide sugar dehydrogenase [Mesorhizobium sp.]|uniref:nucleotide sugar dehydrogenase n=1 Tax=Mesorhizobium sp. TaxID=1871066 RepID=UPI000FE48980|nr:nucleotide sugar dehydrogenase [Mesorhizobium sp.]RWP19308.1 MAG: nucleotide sugar dehydrogenase [Mesorhizobium sp.]